MQPPKRLVLSSVAASILFVAAAAACNAQQASPSPSVPPSATPSASPTPSASAQPSPGAAPAGSPTPSASAQPSPGATPSASPTPQPLFSQQDGDIFSFYNINRDATYYYYFQGNRSGTAKAKNEIRYGRNLWNNSSQIRIRIPYITQYPLVGNPFSGLGNMELGYNYNVSSPKFDHSLEIRGAFATAANNAVQSLDTELKGFYNLKWKFPGASIAYTNEYDQTVIHPPGSSWTSYYEGKLTLPEYHFKHIRGLKFSAIYNFRVLFDTGGIYKSAAGGTLFGNIQNLALLIIDTWGIGSNGLWKFKLEANATVKF